MSLVRYSQVGWSSSPTLGVKAPSRSPLVRPHPLPLCSVFSPVSSAPVITGVFLFASTTARTSDALLGWNCGYTFTSNVMYGVLYAVSPELFLTKDRGTGNAIVASANRVFGIMVRASLQHKSSRNVAD